MRGSRKSNLRKILHPGLINLAQQLLYLIPNSCEHTHGKPACLRILPAGMVGDYQPGQILSQTINGSMGKT